MTSVRLRSAGPDDAENIALLHASSWRRHYRGAYSDSFLDGDVIEECRSVWSACLATTGRAVTIVAEEDSRIVGFTRIVPTTTNAGAASLTTCMWYGTGSAPASARY